MATDLDIFKSLWKSINDIFVLPPPFGSPAATTFLMETPGLTINPDSYDLKKFTDPATMTSPNRATAILCDRVPALAHNFYDSGRRVSSHWAILLQQYGTSEDNPDEKAARAELKKKYDAAVAVLYGSQDGYIKQQKTELLLKLDILHDSTNFVDLFFGYRNSKTKQYKETFL